MEFKFLVKPQITKEYILSKVSQESIFNFYTGMEVTSKKLQLSPFRADNKVTCAFYRSKNDIVYLHDFATNEHISCFEAVMRLYSLTYWEALNKIAADFKLVDNYDIEAQRIEFQPELKETESSIIQCQIKDYTEKELLWWKSFGISQKLLKKFHVFSIQYVFLNRELKFSSSDKNPIYGYYFGKDKNGKEQWKIYFPANKSNGRLRFLGNLKNKKLQGYKQLPENGDILVITKSLKDCMSLRAYKINAVSPSSESTFCTEEQISNFKKRFKHIIVMYDQDRAGLSNMAKIRHKFPELDYFVIPRFLKCKDFSDLRKMYGEEKTKVMLNECLNYFKEKWENS